MAKPAFRIKPYKHPRLKFVVRSKLSGKWERRFFATKGEAHTYVQLKETELLNQGKEGATFPTALRVMAQRESDRLAAFGKTITDATDFYARHLENLQRSAPIERLRDELLESLRSARRDAGYIYDVGNRTKRFCAAFAGRLIAEFETNDIEQYLSAMAVAPGTRNTHRRDLHTMFSYGVEVKKYAATNPVAASTKARGDDDEVEILSVAEVTKLLSSASPDMMPFWTIGCFAGLRRSEIERLDWRDIDFHHKTIHVGGRTKTEKSRRFVTMQPNLIAWLTPFTKESGNVAPINLRKRFDADREAAGMREEWPDNALRHSYGSYHLAKFADMAGLSLQMGNSEAMILKHYRQLVRPKEAIRYWKIRPQAKNGKKIIPFAAAA